MATHLYPENRAYQANPGKFLCSSEHLPAANTALRLLSQFKDLDVRDVQLPTDRKYTCWYVSVVDFPKLPVINLTMYPNDIQNVEFRYMQYVDPLVRDKLVWQTTNWIYARLGRGHYAESQVRQMLQAYVPRVIAGAKAGLLKKGGTSAAEVVVADILEALYPGDVVQGERPEWLRNDDGGLLELDLQVRSERIAFEIQGPHHRLDFFGKPAALDRRKANDKYKVESCMNNSISLIWMDSEGVQKELARMPFEEQKREIQSIIKLAKSKKPCFIDWLRPGDRKCISL